MRGPRGSLVSGPRPSPAGAADTDSWQSCGVRWSWSAGALDRGGNPAVRYNATSQRRYSGVNVLLLWEAALTRGYRNPAWITFNQSNGLGGHVKKGEHATHIVYASTYTKRVRDATNGEESEERRPFLKFERSSTWSRPRGSRRTSMKSRNRSP